MTLFHQWLIVLKQGTPAEHVMCAVAICWLAGMAAFGLAVTP